MLKSGKNKQEVKKPTSFSLNNNLQLDMNRIEEE